MYAKKTLNFIYFFKVYLININNILIGWFLCDINLTFFFSVRCVLVPGYHEVVWSGFGKLSPILLFLGKLSPL